jgi:hypothetical protein
LTPFDFRSKKAKRREMGEKPFYWAFFSWQRMQAFMQEAADALYWRNR